MMSSINHPQHVHDSDDEARRQQTIVGGILGGPLPASVRRAALASTITYVCLAIGLALAFPHRGTGDSVYHLDYMYQLWGGRLPAPTGLAFHYAGTPVETGRQYASAHPPLYYLVSAPFVAPLLHAGHETAGILMARMVNTAMGALTLPAIARLSWEIGGRFRDRLAVTAPLLAALAPTFIRLSGDVYNDVLLTSITAWTLVVLTISLRHGLNTVRVTALTVLVTAGMGTKATFVVTIALVIGALAIRAVLKRRRSTWVLAVTASVLAVVVPLTTWGWFYARNARLSGAWYRSTAKAPVEGRARKSLTFNLENTGFYRIFLERWAGSAGNMIGPVNLLRVFLVISVVSLLLWAAWTVRRRGLHAVARAEAPRKLVPLLVLIGLVVAHYAVQLSQATGYGAYNIRYFLPTLPVFALIWAAAPCLMNRAGRLALAVLAALEALSSVSYQLNLIDSRYDELSSTSPLATLSTAAASNGVPPAVVMSLLVLALGSLCWAITQFPRGTGDGPGEDACAPGRPGTRPVA